MNKILKLDYSTISAWKSCPQKALYQYIEPIAPIGATGSSEALEFGQMIHLALELFGKANLTRKDLTPLDALDQEAAALASGQAPYIDSSRPIDIQILHILATEASKLGISKLLSDERRSLAHLFYLTNRYMHHYIGNEPTFIDFEQRSESCLAILSDGTQLIYGGTLDALTPDSVFETKTSSYINSSFLSRMNPNDQATGYCVLSGRNKVIFNGISTSGYGKSKDAKTSNPKNWTLFKNPEKLFLRSETQRTQAQIDEWKSEVIAIAEDILAYMQHGKLTKRYGSRPDCCTTFNSNCPFMVLCASPDMRQQLETSLFEPVSGEKRWKGFNYASQE